MDCKDPGASLVCRPRRQIAPSPNRQMRLPWGPRRGPLVRIVQFLWKSPRGGKNERISPELPVKSKRKTIVGNALARLAHKE